MTESPSPAEGSAQDWTEQDRQRAHFEAAEILTWGGPGPDTLEPKPLPDRWVDVTDVVLTALERVRSAQASSEDPA